MTNIVTDIAGTYFSDMVAMMFEDRVARNDCSYCTYLLMVMSCDTADCTDHNAGKLQMWREKATLGSRRKVSRVKQAPEETAFRTVTL